jgi:hypothetical protein
MRVTVQLYLAENDTIYKTFPVEDLADIIQHLGTALADARYNWFDIRGLCEDNSCRRDHTLAHLDLDRIRIAIDPDLGRF